MDLLRYLRYLAKIIVHLTALLVDLLDCDDDETPSDSSPRNA